MVRSSNTTEGAVAASHRVGRFLKAVLPLLLVSLIFQTAGCLSPGWEFQKIGEIRIHIGLWYYHGCDELDKCESGPLSDIIDRFALSAYTKTYKDTINEYRGETISAMVSCVVAIIVLRMTRTRLNTPSANTALVVGGIFVLLSGILATTAAGKCADNTRKASELLDSLGLRNPIAFPYSVFITGVGGVLSLLALLLLLASQPWNMSPGNQPPQQQHQYEQPAAGGFSPALTTPVQTVYQPGQQGQPPMYDMTKTAPTAPPMENYGQPAPGYYVTSTQ